MFTGIITDLGRVRALEPRGDTRLTIETGYDTETIVLGASIACSGACLTVVDKGPGWFAADVSAETLSKTTLGDWTPGTAVNLERALRLGEELGGHLVSGHVDGVAEIVERAEEGDSLRLAVAAPACAHALYRGQGVGDAGRGLADRQPGDRRPWRRQLRGQYHSPYRRGDDHRRLDGRGPA